MSNFLEDVTARHNITYQGSADGSWKLTNEDGRTATVSRNHPEYSFTVTVEGETLKEDHGWCMGAICHAIKALEG